MDGWYRTCHARVSKRSQENMKRAEKEIIEEGVAQKKARQEKDIFSEIPVEIQKQINQAVECALKKDSKQPIILQVMVMDEPGQNDYELAYWPSTQEVGERLIKTLVLLRQEDREKHASLVSVLTEEMDEEMDEDFNIYFSGTVKRLTDLGKFMKLSYWDAEEVEGVKYCPRSSLDTFLYHEQCYE